ncbi:MAG: sigma-70 family RNA polymerase sigma factor [Ruminococcaceae bacterium]|nr:sigma-70 family RNA polymerase sigma factor [Oscillospiraceae bacterium]
MLIYLQMIDSQEDRSKFERLYLMYRDYMYRVAFGILQNSDDAEDAVHHAFVKIAENIDRLGTPGTPATKAYAVAIVKNSAIDSYRKKQAHPQVEYSDETVGMEVCYESDNALTNCILKLPQNQRIVLILRHHHGYDLREIAQLLGLTYRNTRQIEQRAKAKLRTLCEEAGIAW